MSTARAQANQTSAVLSNARDEPAVVADGAGGAPEDATLFLLRRAHQADREALTLFLRRVTNAIPDPNYLLQNVSGAIVSKSRLPDMR